MVAVALPGTERMAEAEAVQLPGTPRMAARSAPGAPSDRIARQTSRRTQEAGQVRQVAPAAQSLAGRLVAPSANLRAKRFRFRERPAPLPGRAAFHIAGRIGRRSGIAHHTMGSTSALALSLSDLASTVGPKGTLPRAWAKGEVSDARGPIDTSALIRRRPCDVFVNGASAPSQRWSEIQMA
jgi:hypothetical protein